MKRFAIFGIIIVCIIAMVFLNKSISQNAGSDGDDDSQSSQSAQKTPPKPAASAPAGPQSADVLPPEQIIGDAAKAKYVVKVGWMYTSANQADSTALVNALKPVQQLSTASHGQIAAEIVDLDVPVTERSKEAQSVTQPGVVITGTAPGSKTIDLEGNPGEGAVVGQRIYQTMTSLSL